MPKHMHKLWHIHAMEYLKCYYTATKDNDLQLRTHVRGPTQINLAKMTLSKRSQMQEYLDMVSFTWGSKHATQIHVDRSPHVGQLCGVSSVKGLVPIHLPPPATDEALSPALQAINS